MDSYSNHLSETFAPLCLSRTDYIFYPVPFHFPLTEMMLFSVEDSCSSRFTQNDTVSTVADSALPAEGISHDVPDPHAPSAEEALSYYVGLPSKPRLIYRTGQEKWCSPKGPGAYPRRKQLVPVFDHPMANAWNEELSRQIANILDKNQVFESTSSSVVVSLLIE